MSLSPICSIIKDFLAVTTVSVAESDFLGSKLSDMCRDLGGTFLVLSLDGFELLDEDEPLAFVTESRGADFAPVEADIGFDTLGVVFCSIFDTLAVVFCGIFDTLGVVFCGIFDTLGVEFCGVFDTLEVEFCGNFDTLGVGF